MSRHRDKVKTHLSHYQDVTIATYTGTKKILSQQYFFIFVENIASWLFAIRWRAVESEKKYLSPTIRYRIT